MKKLNIEEFAKLELLKNIRLVFWCLGGISWILAFSAFPQATRSPGAMAMSAFSAFVEAAKLSWMVIPTLMIGVVFLVVGLVITWKIKKDYGDQCK